MIIPKKIFTIQQGEIDSYLKNRGVKLVEHLDNQQIEQEFLLKADGSLLGHMTGHFCFALASPSK